MTLVLLLLFYGCGENNKISEDSKSSNPDEMIAIAVEKQRIGGYDEAIAILNSVLKANPKMVKAYYQMGLVYGEADQRDEAIDSFNKALEIEPQNLLARLGLGDIYSKMTRNDLAVAEFLKAESLKPKDTKILFKIALEYWYDQKLSESAEYYQKVLALNPDHMQAHLNIISVYEKLKDWDRALEEIAVSKRLSRKTQDDHAFSIADRKLAFIKGRMNMTDKEYKRRSQPPFE